MNKSISKATFGLIAAASIGFLAPSATLAAEGYTSAGQIIDFGPREVSIDIYMPGPSSPMNCSQPGWFRLKTSVSNYDLIASFLLTQFAQKAPVRLYVSGCDYDGASIVVAARVT